MRAQDVLHAALQSLKGNRTRSWLTVLGLSIGVGACIAIGSLGTAAVSEVRQEMDRFGVDRIWIAESPGNEVRMQAEDVRVLSGVGDAVAPMCYDAVRAVWGTQAKNCALVATNADYAGIENIRMLEGRFLFPQDGEHLLRTVVIEDILKEELFGSAQALGEKIRLGEHSYTVVGVIKTQYSEYFAAEAGNPKAYVPIETYQQLNGLPIYDEIVVRAEGVSVQTAAARAKSALKNVHGAQDSFIITSMAEQIASADRILSIITTVLIVVGVICMITGGVGVMNVMLTSVRERRREIGIRKALGAKDSEIFCQFVCEAAIYGACGAAAGAALGALFTELGQGIIGVEAKMVLWVTVCAILFSCFVGAVCGVYPAMRAAAVSPVTAMRQT